MVTKTPKAPLIVETLNHDATHKNIPTAEFQSVMAEDEQKLVRVEYEHRNRDLDPQRCSTSTRLPLKTCETCA